MNTQVEPVSRQRAAAPPWRPARSPSTSQAPTSRRVLPEVRSRAVIEAAEQSRWVRIVGAPFVVSAVFFGAAIATGSSWLIGPAIVLGPILMVAAYLYVMLSSDANAAAGSQPMLQEGARAPDGALPSVRAA